MLYEYHKISHLGSIRQGGYLTQRDIASRRGCIAAEKDIRRRLPFDSQTQA